MEEKLEKTGFDALNIDERILRAVKEMGFEQMSPIQAKAIPPLLEGQDVMGQAQTGTGKTAAFGIPLIQKIDSRDHHTQAIILCPTRELAIQVAEEIRKFAKFMHGVKVLPIYGGQEITKQIRSLKGGIQIVVGTPGRVMDHMRRHTIRMDEIKTVVLDEADEMLNMGFRDDIETILNQIPEEHQTMLFSATMPQSILDIARKYQKDAVSIRVAKKELTVPMIEQSYYEVRNSNKDEALSRLIDYYNPKLSLVFCNTKKTVDELTEKLQGRGYFAEGLHGDMKQAQRDRVMNKFKNGKADILVATDVAARGLDIDDVEAVFNYNVPQDEENYVHRVGRTGRAGRTGKAFTLVAGKEVYKLRDIQRYCKVKIKAKQIPTADDIAYIKVENTLNKITEIIESEDLTSMIEQIQTRINEDDMTAIDIAAAFLKLSLGEDQTSISETKDSFENTGAEEGMVRLFVNVGKRNNIRPGDIVGAIAGESGMPGRLIGIIDVYDKYTFVEVPREYADEVVEAMKQAKIKGKLIHVEPANRS